MDAHKVKREGESKEAEGHVSWLKKASTSWKSGYFSNKSKFYILTNNWEIF